MAFSAPEQAAAQRTAATVPADFDGNQYETKFPASLNDVGVLAPAVAREADAAVAAGAAAVGAASTATAKAAEIVVSATAAKASADSAAALAAAFEIDPVKRTKVPASYDLRFVPEVTPAGLTLGRTTPATRINRVGRLENVAANLLRHDYDPVTGAYRGVLIEEQRANLCRWSEALDNAAWSMVNATVVPNGAAGPDGLTSLDKIVSAASGFGYLHQAAVNTLAANVPRTFSGFVRAAELSSFQHLVIGAVFGGGANRVAQFDLAAGSATVTGGSGMTAGLINWGGGLYRWWMAIVPTVSGTTQIQWYRAITAGDGVKGIFGGFCQAEDGAFPTSYIKSEGDAVTRAADLPTTSFADLGFNPTEGTVLVEYEWLFRQSIPNVFYRIFDFSDGTNSNNILLRTALTSAYFQILANGAGQVGIEAGNFGAPIRAASAWKTNDFALSVNGDVPLIDNAGVVPTGLNTFKLGRQYNDSQVMSGWIRSLAYFPRRLSNTDLQAISKRAA